jgi:hypothetical protein
MSKNWVTWLSLFLASTAGTVASEFVSQKNDERNSIQALPAEVVAPTGIDLPAAVAFRDSTTTDIETVHN